MFGSREGGPEVPGGRYRDRWPVFCDRGLGGVGVCLPLPLNPLIKSVAKMLLSEQFELNKEVNTYGSLTTVRNTSAYHHKLTSISRHHLMKARAISSRPGRLSS
jgi:hypothetical protein